MDESIFLGSLIHPTKWYCLPSWINSLKDIKGIDEILLVSTGTEETYDTFIDSIQYPVVKEPKQNMFESISHGRKKLFEEFLETENEYFLSLECDIFSEPNVGLELLKHKKIHASVPYIIGYMYEGKRRLKTDYLLSATNQDRVHFTFEELSKKSETSSLVEINEAGMGCSLIHRSVIETYLPKSIISKERLDDKFFYEHCREKGIKRYIDMNLFSSIKHYPHFHMNYAVHKKYLERNS